MRAIHELEERRADRSRFATGSMGSNVGQTLETDAGAPGATAESFSVRLIAADGDDQSVAVVSVHGEIDLGTAPVLRDALMPVLRSGAGPVVIDLSETAFMDSTGMHVLVDGYQELRTQNRRFAIACRDRSQVHRLLALVGLLDRLNVYPSRESAVIGGDDHFAPSLPAAPVRPLGGR